MFVLDNHCQSKAWRNTNRLRGLRQDEGRGETILQRSARLPTTNSNSKPKVKGKGVPPFLGSNMPMSTLQLAFDSSGFGAKSVACEEPYR